jgi:hypothetical protein
MSLRSLALAFADGAGSARATSGGGAVATGGGSEIPAAPGTNGLVKKGSDAWWNLQGGPWCAKYHHFASLTAIGVFEGEPHREHFTDPFLALEYFRLPQFDRYRENHILRQSCLIVYKDNWYCAQPFAETADHDVEVLRAEVARDVASGAAT